MEHYTGTLEEMEILDAKISENCNWPIGGTKNWATPRLTTTGVYSIPVPEGSHHFTKEQMNASINTESISGVEFPQGEE